MDMLLCDLQSAYKLIQQCQFVTNSQIESDDTNLALINKPESEVQIEIDGQLKLSDLMGPERIEPSEIELITKETRPALSRELS